MKLFEKGYLSDKDEIKVKKPLTFKPNYTPNSIWLKDYEYSYDNDNREKIIKLFG